MSISRDDEFMDTIKFSNNNVAGNISKEEKELTRLQMEKEQQLLSINKQYLENLFVENSTQPIKIRNVQFTNSQNYRDSFLEYQLTPLLQPSVLSLKKYLESIEEISKNLIKIGIVENVLVNTHLVNQSKPAFHPPSNNLNVVPLFNTVPIKKFFAKTGTNIGNGEGDGYIQFQYRNIFGGGENLIFDAVTGTKTKSSYLVNYNQPIMNNCNYKWENSFITNSRKLDWIQCNMTSIGFINKIHTQYNDKHKLNHEIVMENNWKTLTNSNSKSFEILQQCGPQYKSSIGYNLIYNTRDNDHLPTKGQFYQFGVEYNGLLKANKFPYLKTCGSLQSVWNLPQLNSNLIANLKTGLLYPMTESSSLLDRFYIGGPNDVRAFNLNGLGPKDFNSFTGGDLFSNGGVSLITNIPRHKDSNFKIHNFINWGRLSKYNHDLNVYNNLKSLTHSYCISYGFGILYNHPMARFELNFVLPLIANRRDSIRKGIQYGIGISFL